MRAVKLKVEIEPSHEVHLRLPDDVPEGPAEVIVLIDHGAEEADTPPQKAARLRKMWAEHSGNIGAWTREELYNRGTDTR